VPLPPPQPAPSQAPVPAPDGRRRGVSWKTLLAVALVMALGGALAGVLASQGDAKSSAGSESSSSSAGDQQTADAPSSPAAGSSPDGGDSPVPAPTDGATGTPGAGASATGGATRWTPLVSKVELDVPATEYSSDAYQVDLTAGKLIAPGSGGKWVLALRNAGGSGTRVNAFANDGDDESDFAVITDPSVTPSQCNTAIDTHPDSDLGFGHAGAGRLLCIRDRTTHTVAIAAIEVADEQTGEVKLSVSTWQSTG
jgi:hypothetical protein